MFNEPTKTLHINSDGIALTDGVAANVSTVITAKVQKGLAYVFPGVFRLIMKLYDNATPDEMPVDTEFGFAYLLPGHRRPIPIGVMTMYSKWRRLTTTQQGDDDFKDSVVVNLGIPVLALREDESLIIQTWSASGTVDASECEFYIPYAQGSPAEVTNELKQRVIRYGS